MLEQTISHFTFLMTFTIFLISLFVFAAVGGKLLKRSTIEYTPTKRALPLKTLVRVGVAALCVMILTSTSLVMAFNNGELTAFLP